MKSDYQIIQGDCLTRLREMASESVHCCVTSPPYFGLRDYGTADWSGGDADCDHKRGNESWVNGPSKDSGSQQIEKTQCTRCNAVRIDSQIGLESTPALFIAKMVEVFEEVRRVLRLDGVLFLNLGDSYSGSGKGIGSDHGKAVFSDEHIVKTDWLATGFKNKDLMLIPHRVAIVLQDAGWWVRSDMPWVKRSAMPESVTDRPAKALEYVFMLTKSAKYFCDMEAVRARMAESSVQRLSQNVAEQACSSRVPGKTNGNMKAVAPANWKGSSFEKGKTGEHRLGRSQKDRDRSLPTNRNGITGSLDETPAGGRNFRNSDLWYSSIKEPHGLVGIDDDLVGLAVNPAGFKESHFATFPTKLIEPLIKMGTSEKGCCAGCGSPWERITERIKAPRREVKSVYAEQASKTPHGFLSNGRFDEPEQVNTTGWQKTCKCETDEVVPCTVLDPFAGAGTTLLVAKRLGRTGVGIELNPDYIEMIERRLEHWHRPAPPPVKTESAMPLFDE